MDAASEGVEEDRPLPEPPVPRPLGPLIPAREAQVWLAAEAILEEARDYARRMRERADADYEAERKRGYRDGRDDAAGSIAEQLLRSALAADDHLKAIDASLPRVALDMVARIIGSFEPGDAQARAVATVLDELRDANGYKLQVPPGLPEETRERIGSLLEARKSAVVLVVDPGLDEGRCVLSGPSGSVELGLAMQIEALNRVLQPDAEA